MGASNVMDKGGKSMDANNSRETTDKSPLQQHGCKSMDTRNNRPNNRTNTCNTRGATNSMDKVGAWTPASNSMETSNTKDGSNSGKANNGDTVLKNIHFKFY